MPTAEAIKKFRNPFPTTDIIIEYTQGKKSGVVLITRKNSPYGIAIPGGFAEYGISLEDNARKEAKEETGLEVILESPEHPLCVHSGPDRDPRAHMISITYVGRGEGILRAGDDASTAKVYTLPELTDLVKNKRNMFAFEDHARAIEEYLRHDNNKYAGMK